MTNVQKVENGTFPYYKGKMDMIEDSMNLLERISQNNGAYNNTNSNKLLTDFIEEQIKELTQNYPTKNVGNTVGNTIYGLK